MLRKFLVLLALTGFALTDPVLTIFGANPEIFYFHNIESTQLILVYALTVALLPAVILWLPLFVAGYLNNRLSTGLYLGSISALAGLWLVQLLKWSFGLHLPLLVGLLGAAGGLLFLLAFLRWQMVESWLQIAAIAPVLMVGFFLFNSAAGVAIAHSDATQKVVTSQQNLPPVVFILLDEFPTLGLLNENEVIDSQRFPAIANLASQATWYRHYSVIHSSTKI